MNLFWQGSRASPARDRDEFDELWVTEHFVTLLTALFTGVSGAIDAVAAANGFAVHSERQNSLNLTLEELVEMMSHDDPNSEINAKQEKLDR